MSCCRQLLIRRLDGRCGYDNNPKMETESLSIEQCQEHAKACREMARRETDPQTRKRLEDLASSWEELCEEIGKVAKLIDEETTRVPPARC